MNLSRRTFAVLSIFWGIFALFVVAQAILEADFTFKATVKQDTITLDTTIALSFTKEAFELTTTWKATEKKFSSLKIAAETDFAEDIKGRLELLFDTENLKSLKLKGSDLPCSNGFFDIETYFKYNEALTLYQVTANFDDLTVAKLPASIDLVLREAYLRAKLTLEYDDDTLSIQGIWKKGAFYEGTTTFTHDEATWSAKEQLTFKPGSSLLHAEKGQLTVDWDPSDVFSLKAVCEHTFCNNAILVAKLTPTMKLEIGEFELTWQGAYQPQGTVLCLGAYTLTLDDEVEIGSLSLKTVLKIKEDGFYSFSVQLSFGT